MLKEYQAVRSAFSLGRCAEKHRQPGLFDYHLGMIELRTWINLAAAVSLVIATNTVAAPQAIRPGELWLDGRGQHIQAHGGGIIKLDNTYYWFGEDRSQGLDRSKRYVSCYASTDLAHWTFRNQALKFADPENFGPRRVVERPKVFFNAKSLVKKSVI